MASLRDVANRAGVSVATASRVASGSAAVRPKTREKVERAMRDLLYVPSRPHRAERRDRPPGCPSSATRCSPPLPRRWSTRDRGGVLDDHLQHGRVGDAGGRLRRHAPRAPGGGDGLRVRERSRTSAGSIRITPSSWIRAPGSSSCTVLGVAAGDVGRGRRARVGPHRHRAPAGLGHRRIGFVAGESFALATRDKARGREEALAPPRSRPRLRRRLRRVLRRRRAARAPLGSSRGSSGDGPTAVICSNDLMAIGAMQEAAALGLRVPGDLSIVGFDGIDAAAWTQPPLTTIEQPIDEIAGTAIEAMQALVDGPGQTLPSYASARRSAWAGLRPPPAA